MSNKWIPEILYEENSEGLTRGLPFVNVPKEKSMPGMIFLYESRDLKDLEEEEVEKEIILHSYANMTLLKQELDLEIFNKVRVCLGLEELKLAEESGKKIIDNVKNNIKKLEE